MAPVVLRPRFVWAVLAVFVAGTAVAVMAGAGWYSLGGVAFVALLAYLCRQSLHIDAERVRYRSLLPGEDFGIAWRDVSEVVVDIVRTSAPGSPSSPVARARFLHRDGPAHVAILFSRDDGEAIVRVCRQLGVPVVDERGAPKGG